MTLWGGVGLVYYRGVGTAEWESQCDHPKIRDATSLLFILNPITKVSVGGNKPFFIIVGYK